MNPRNWETIEARFQCAKLALQEAQEQHCAAAQEFQQARAELRQVLEAIFPEPSFSEPSFSELFGCNRAADTLARCHSGTTGEVYSGDKLSPVTAD